jgi:hypothetical protein
MTMIGRGFRLPEGSYGYVRFRSIDALIAIGSYGYKRYVEGMTGGSWDTVDIDPIEMALEGRTDDLHRLLHLNSMVPESK